MKRIQVAVANFQFGNFRSKIFFFGGEGGKGSSYTAEQSSKVYDGFRTVFLSMALVLIESLVFICMV